MNEFQMSYDEFYELYVNKCILLYEIAKTYGVSTKQVSKVRQEYGIPPRAFKRTHYFNEKYFDVIDSPKKAYLLGLIASDGCITTSRKGKPGAVGLGLHIQDMETMEFFKSELETTASITAKGNSASITVNSVHMAGVLTSYGIPPRKSLTLDLKDIIEKAVPTEYVNDFLLGFFDGDGGIYECKGQWSCGFTSTLSTCEFLKSYFNQGFLVDEKTKSGVIYTFKMSGKNRVFEGLSQLYGSASFEYSMKRKREKFLVLKSLLNQR